MVFADKMDVDKAPSQLDVKELKRLRHTIKSSSQNRSASKHPLYSAKSLYKLKSCSQVRFFSFGVLFFGNFHIYIYTQLR